LTEPIAFYDPHKGFYWAKPTKITAPVTVDVEPLALYTQRTWVNLTNAEIGEIYRVGWANNMELARAIEAKLREKNERTL
jgi:hypothetical protein